MLLYRNGMFTILKLKSKYELDVVFFVACLMGYMRLTESKQILIITESKSFISESGVTIEYYKSEKA